MQLINKDFIILVVGLCVASIFYVFGTFGYKYLQMNGFAFQQIFILSMISGIILFSIKIPLLYYYGQENTVLTHMLYTVILASAIAFYSKFILHEKVSSHTYIILVSIIGLLIVDMYLNKLRK